MIDLFEGLRLASDTGVLVLIWLVQLVIYPSLERYSEPNLKSWHPNYTRRVTFVVLPLMFTQLGLSVYQVLIVSTVMDFAHLFFVLVAWVITFFKAVPLHQSLDLSVESVRIAQQLTRTNIGRTIAWSAAWLVSLIVIF